jgi:hypothetical protein
MIALLYAVQYAKNARIAVNVRVWRMQKVNRQAREWVYAQAAQNGEAPDAQERRPVIVWYKHDLRTHDHAGLSKALASGRPAFAFFCFDPKTLGDQLLHMWGPAVVHGAITDLRRSLEDLRCPLIVRTGNTVAELLAVVQETGAEIVSSHSEVEYQWLIVEQAIRDSVCHCPAALSLNVRDC